MLDHPNTCSSKELFAAMAISIREVGQGTREGLIVRISTENDEPIPMVVWDFLLDLKDLHGVSYQTRAYPGKGHILSIIKDELLESP